MKVNRNMIAAQVNAAAELTIEGESIASIIKRLINPVPYEYGLFPEQDARVVASVFYSLVSEVISLVPYSDKPLQDQPKEGSLDANDTGRGDEQAEEREEARINALRLLASFERHSRSLHERTRAVKEEAGAREGDGGRIRFKRHSSTWVMPAMSAQEALKDAVVRAIPNTPWAFKAQIALDELADCPFFYEDNDGVIRSRVAETDAEVVVSDILQDDDNGGLDRCASKAWERILETLFELGIEVTRHQDVMEKLNEDLSLVYEAYTAPERKTKVDLVKSQMALATREYKEAINRPLWLLGKQLEPVSLLAHNGAPKHLIESPEWRTKEAEQQARKAQSDVALAQAQMTEMNANMALMEANFNLMKVRAAMAEQQKAMEAQMKEMAEFMKPAKTKEPKAEKPKAEKAEKKAKAEKPLPKGATILNSRSAFNAPVYRRGM